MRPPHGTTPAAVTTNNNNIQLRSSKSSEKVQKKEGGPDSTVSNNQISSVTLNELVIRFIITFTKLRIARTGFSELADSLLLYMC